MVPFGRWTLAVVALSLCPALGLAAPAGPAAPAQDNTLSPVERLHQALEKPISIKFDNMTLAAAIDALRKQTNIKIILDSQTIAQTLGYAPEQSPPCGAIELKDVKARTALRTVLAPYNLGYIRYGDALLVTTEDMAMMRLLKQQVTIDIDKGDVAGALEQIAHDTGVNIILDKKHADKQAQTPLPPLHMEDVELATAVRLLAVMAGLKPVRVGNVLFITSKDNAKDMMQDPDIAQPNQGARADQLQLQQQLQFQFANQAVIGNLGGLGGLAPGTTITLPVVPPNVQPAVQPAAAPKDDAPAPGADKPKDSPPPM
jgi:hypothetical protein